MTNIENKTFSTQKYFEREKDGATTPSPMAFSIMTQGIKG
jgi:hypothetical protein